MGAGKGPSLPGGAWRPEKTREPGTPGGAKPAPPPRWAGNWRIRWSLLRQVVRMRAVPDADGSCPSRYEGRFTGIPPGIAMELPCHASRLAPQGVTDRKSTRLNSSHLVISYAVFCLQT